MKLSALILLPATALAFAPQQPVSLFPTSRVSNVALRDVRDDFDDAVKKIEDTTEDYVGKADELVISRGMRFANHLPVLVTLKALADKAGMSASLNGGIVAVSSQLATIQFGDDSLLVCVRSLHFWPMMSSILIISHLISFFYSVGVSSCRHCFCSVYFFLPSITHDVKTFSFRVNRRPRHLADLALPFRSPPGASTSGLWPLWLS